MEGETATDVIYDLIEYMEDQRHWIVLIIFACLILAPSGLLLNVTFFLIYFSRVPFAILSVRGFFFLLNIAICLLLVYFGINQAKFLRKWNKKLRMIERFEREIFEEVVEEE